MNLKNSPGSRKTNLNKKFQKVWKENYLYFETTKKNFLKHTEGESLIERIKEILSLGLEKANDNDLVVLSDSDEIPDLKKLNQSNSPLNLLLLSDNVYV